MDAIIYFTKKRGLRKRSIVFVRQKDYLLVRVELDAGREHWFGQELPCLPQPPREPVSGGWLKKRRERQAAEKNYQERQQAYELFIRRLKGEIRGLAEETEEILRRSAVTGSVSCVYERELSFLLGGESLTAAVWSQEVTWPLFRDYTVFRWMRPLLEEIRETEFLLLGYADDIPLLLEHCAGRMRELRWFLEESDRAGEAEQIAEDFYIESGLAASVRVLEGRHPFRRAVLNSQNPACVLDLTEEVKFLPGKLAAGSLWIDFLSMPEKEERIRRLAPGVRYLSLKKRWQQLEPKSRRAPDLSGISVAGDRPGYNPELRLK